MKRRLPLLCMVCVLLVAVTVEARAVTIATVPIGNPGNANDPADGDEFTAGVQNFGAVRYAYNIGKYDVTNSQYAEFLNAKDQTGANTLGLWNLHMAQQFGGINFNPGNANGSKYTLILDRQDQPIVNVTWYNAIRFTNWLNNGQGDSSTETGAYTLLHDGSLTPTPTPSNGNDIARNASAAVFLPSENEWYKAAYYDPATASYFQYPTGSNSTPIASGPTGLANHANYDGFSNPAAVGNLTNVGAYTGTTSPYGVFDMGGNAFQWNEALFETTGGYFRGARGGSWLGTYGSLLSSDRDESGATTEDNFELGFRVASTAVPEPSSLLLALAVVGAIGFVAGCARAKSRRSTNDRIRRIT